MSAVLMASSKTNQRKMEGKVAVVAGSTSGIGLAIARRLAQEGAKVMVSSRKQENVDSAVELLRSEPGKLAVEGVVCHVGKQEHRKNMIEKAVSKFGGIDFLIINAASNPAFGPSIDTPSAAWDKIFDVNVKAAALLTKEALPYLKERQGSVVLVSSVTAYGPNLTSGVYGVSKAALFGLTKVLSVELAPHKVRVNCLAPGLIKTKFGQVLWGCDQRRGETLKNVPMNRVGQPEECAGVVMFLCSEDAAYITGETVVSAGGMMSRL